MGPNTLQSQLDSLSSGGSSFSQQAGQLLQQLPQQLRHSLGLDSNSTSMIGPSLTRAQQALLEGPASALAAFGNFTASFQDQFNTAGDFSP